MQSSRLTGGRMHRPRCGLSHGIRDVTRFFHRQFSRAPGGSVVWASRQFGGRQLALDCLDLRRSTHGGSLGQLLCHAHEIRSRSLGGQHSTLNLGGHVEIASTPQGDVRPLAAQWRWLQGVGSWSPRITHQRTNTAERKQATRGRNFETIAPSPVVVVFLHQTAQGECGLGR